MLQAFALSFVPLFVAIDAPMAIPVFASMTASVAAPRRRKIADEAILAALLVGLLFLLTGKAVFGVVGITENDFRVGGGLVLLITAILHLSKPAKPLESEEHHDSISGASPLGIPLIMGPASITTIILAVKSCGYFATFLAIGLNLLIVWLAFRNSQHLIRFIGLKNMNVISKLASLMLVSIAVMMIRVGIKSFIN